MIHPTSLLAQRGARTAIVFAVLKEQALQRREGSNDLWGISYSSLKLTRPSVDAAEGRGRDDEDAAREVHEEAKAEAARKAAREAAREAARKKKAAAAEGEEEEKKEKGHRRSSDPKSRNWRRTNSLERFRTGFSSERFKQGSSSSGEGGDDDEAGESSWGTRGPAGGWTKPAGRQATARRRSSLLKGFRMKKSFSDRGSKKNSNATAAAASENGISGGNRATIYLLR